MRFDSEDRSSKSDMNIVDDSIPTRRTLRGLCLVKRRELSRWYWWEVGTENRDRAGSA